MLVLCHCTVPQYQEVTEALVCRFTGCEYIECSCFGLLNTHPSFWSGCRLVWSSRRLFVLFVHPHGDQTLEFRGRTRLNYLFLNIFFLWNPLNEKCKSDNDVQMNREANHGFLSQIGSMLFLDARLLFAFIIKRHI